MAEVVQIPVLEAGTRPADEVLSRLGVTTGGLSSDEVARRAARFGPNAVASHRARWLPVLVHQLRSALQGLLVAAATVSHFVGERADALIIVVIISASVVLGLVNEYRAERAAQALHSQFEHRTVVLRDGRPSSVDVKSPVPDDVVDVRLGDIVPADLRLLSVPDLECQESVLTGESLPVEKSTATVPVGAALAELTGCALMGTVVHAGAGRGVVVAIAGQTEFGATAVGLSTRAADTEFQLGLRRFSMLLAYVAGALTTGIFVINVALQRPVIDALLISLAIAVGITPQLLPAVVSTSLAAGARQMSKRRVLVKRLVCIEDLGDVGRRGRHPAREEPQRAGRRRHRGTAHLRQHDQVRPDGHLQQLREHVLGRRSIPVPVVPVVPADAALADPAEQPVVRHQSAGDSHRRRGRGAAASPVALGHRFHPPVHDRLRTAELGVRLRHVRAHALGLRLRRRPVPLRLVRRVARTALPLRQSRHPDPRQAVTALGSEPASGGQRTGSA